MSVESLARRFAIIAATLVVCILIVSRPDDAFALALAGTVLTAAVIAANWRPRE